MATGGDNRTVMLEPWIVTGQIATLRLELVKSSDAAVLVGVGNKDTSLDYYLGQS